MARRDSQTERRQLRRLALSGDRIATEQFLLRYLSQHPEDSFMQEELRRLRSNCKLLVTETAAERRQRLVTEQLHTLSRILTTNPPDILHRLPEPELQKLSTELRRVVKALKEISHKQPDSLSHYKSLLRAELNKRRRARWRRLLPKIGWAAMALLVLTALVMLARSKALQWESELITAVQKQQPEQVRQTLQVLDAPFYRFVAPGITAAIADANRWLTDLQTREERLKSRFSLIESGEIRVAAMPLSERALIENELTTLPAVISSPLLKRWQNACEREHAALQQQKLDFISKLQRPLPPYPTFTGDPGKDLAACCQQIVELRLRETEFLTAPASYELPPTVIAPVHTRTRELQAATADIRSYQLLRADLKRCRSYTAHIAAIERCGAATAYPPAAERLTIAPLLPPENDVKSSLSSYGYTEPDMAKQTAMVATLLKGGPTFSATYPATEEQVHMVQDLFTAPSLHTRLYKVTTADGKTAYSEQPPELDHADNRVYLTRSDLDPEQNMDNRQVVLEGIDSVNIVLIDTPPLAAKIKFGRRDFFLKVNVLKRLNQVLNFRHRDCPALAQAYVYHTLLNLLLQHSEPDLTGLRHSPTLGRHAEEFRSLAQKHRKLIHRPGSWLQDTPATRQAERDFCNWFTRNAGCNYCDEIKQNFGPLARIGLQYSGYIDENGQADLFRELPEGKVIWYMTADGFKSAPIGTELEAPLPFSPIFNAL